jgi:hypothetical protein
MRASPSYSWVQPERLYLEAASKLANERRLPGRIAFPSQFEQNPKRGSGVSVWRVRAG